MSEDKKPEIENKKRTIIIETDGDSISVKKESNTTPLEMCEICRRIIKMMKGDVI